LIAHWRAFLLFPMRSKPLRFQTWRASVDVDP
jgi:hypothetical protein